MFHLIDKEHETEVNDEMNSSKVISDIFDEVLEDDRPDIEQLKKEMRMTLETENEDEQEETLNISSMSLLTPLTEAVASPEVRIDIGLSCRYYDCWGRLATSDKERIRIHNSVHALIAMPELSLGAVHRLKQGDSFSSSKPQGLDHLVTWNNPNRPPNGGLKGVCGLLHNSLYLCLPLASKGGKKAAMPKNSSPMAWVATENRSLG